MNEKIGIVSWTLGIKNLEKLFKKIKSYKLDGMQYCLPVENYTASEVLQMAKKYNLKILAYDPFETKPQSKEEATFENAINFYTKNLLFAKELNVPLTLQGLTNWVINKSTDLEKWEMFKKLCLEISKLANDHNVRLLIEPCNLYEIPLLNKSSDYQRLLDETKISNIEILLDSFHMNIEEVDPIKTLEKYSQTNSIFHISNSNRGGIDFGNIDFKTWGKTLYTNGFSGPSVLEVVLPSNPVNTPPRNDQEWEDFDKQILHSIAQWRIYLKALKAN